jgi:hypothetical protein
MDSEDLPIDWRDKETELNKEFNFMGENVVINLFNKLEKTARGNRTSSTTVETELNTFFAIMWSQIGRTPLKQLYYEPYKKVQITNMESGWSQKDNDEYGNYFAVVLLLNSIEKAIAERDTKIKNYETLYNKLLSDNKTISNSLLISNPDNFSKEQLVRLNAFFREDELHLDDIVTTTQDSIADTYKNQQDAMESARIELQKLCQPQLQFSMTMANIYAMPEFEPIIDQFQLGNVIKVALRPDYIKQSRLLQVDINFDDFSDFSCEFGDLTDFKTQSDIHADLLSKAISAGKSVATNASYWTKGSDQATATDLKIQQGLLDATTQIKSLDGTQSVIIDKYGIKLQKQDPDSGAIDPHQTWLVNNKILMTDDNWRTSRSGLGQFTIDDKEFYGLIAEAVFSGYIEGSQIRGGTIKIGEQGDGTYAFEVREDGSVTMNGGNSLPGYAKEDDVAKLKKEATVVSDIPPEEPIDGQMWLDTSTDPYALKIYNNNQWVYFNQQEGGKIYTSEPTKGTYAVGDMWLVTNETVEINGIEYGPGSILKANADLEWVDAIPEYTELLNNTKQYFNFNADDGLKIGQKDEKFYVGIQSTKMGFHSVEYNADGTVKKDSEVVHIGNNSATIQNATFQGDRKEGTVFDSKATFKKEVQFGGSFMWQVEENDSLSLAIIS